MLKTAFCGRPGHGVNRRITKTLLVEGADNYRPHRTRRRTIIRAMKLTVILLTTCFLHVAASGLSQEITLKTKQLSLKQVFAAVKKQTGYVVVYNPDLIVNISPAAMDVVKKPLKDFLNEVLDPGQLTFTIKNTTIVISRKTIEPTPVREPQLLVVAPPLTGVIRAADGTALAGASIRIKGKSTGTTTDENGRFKIDADPGEVLIISFTGYQMRELMVTAAMIANPGNPLSISMTLAETAMEDVVVKAGYYDVRKKEMVGNISKVSAKEIGRQPVSNPLAALTGRVAGLDVIQESGLPGTGFTLRLRGLNSVREEANSPLIIIDGTPYPSGSFDNPSGNTADNASNRTLLGYVSASPLNSINPNDIESIEVLKDADATSIYGSRGGNGVILITTKKGKAGKTAVNVNFSSGTAKIARKVDVLDRRQYLDMRYEAIKNDGQTIATAQQSTVYDLVSWDTTRSTDWQDVLLGGTAHYTRAQISLSGGNSNTSFLLSGNYSRETTIFPVDLANTRFNGRLNVNHTSNNQRLQAQFSVNFGQDNNKLPGWSIAAYALTLPPVAPALYDSTGKLNWGPGSTFQNPMARLKEIYDGKIRSMVSSAMVSYKVFKGFKAKASLGYNQVQNDAISKRPQEFFDPIEWLTRGKFLRSSNTLKVMTTTWNAEPQLEYETMIGSGKLTALAGVTFQQTKTNGLVLDVNNYPDDALMGNTNFGVVEYSYTQNSEYLYNAVFGRINYNIASKYIVNVTARRDGSGRFAPGKRFGNFASAGAAWNFGDETFVQNAIPFLSAGKLRASYGTTGNDIIPDYGYLSLYNATNQYNGSLSLTPAGLYNDKYSWETNKKAEVGLELAFLNNNLSIAASYYRNRSSSQLVAFPLPSTVGFTSIQSNLPAVIQNTGLELELSSVNMRKKNFTWNSSFNISFPRNKLVSYPNIAGSPYAYIYTEGMPLSIIKTYNRVGVDPLTGYNVWRSPTRGKDTSRAGALALADRTNDINLGKELFGGINNIFQYKQFELSFFFNFGKQTGASTYSNLFNAKGRAANMPVDRYERRWQEKGDVTDVQRLSNNGNSLANLSNVGNAWDPSFYTTISFLRLKNVSFSYSLPENVTRKISIQGCRFYVQGQNILTFTNYRGWDPENQSGNYPLLRVWTAGIELNL